MSSELSIKRQNTDMHHMNFKSKKLADKKNSSLKYRNNETSKIFKLFEDANL